MLDDLVIECVPAQDDWPAQVYVEILKGYRKHVPPVKLAENLYTWPQRPLIPNSFHVSLGFHSSGLKDVIGQTQIGDGGRGKGDSADMYCSERGTRRLRTFALWLVSSAIINKSAEPSPSEPNRANSAFKISLIGVLILVPVDLFVSYGFISNVGLFTQSGVLLIIFFVFSLGVAIPLATLLLHFDAKQRVSWGIILIASSSVLGFLSIAAGLINFGASGSIGSEAGLLTFLSVTMDIGCLFTFVGGTLAITICEAQQQRLLGTQTLFDQS